MYRYLLHQAVQLKAGRHRRQHCLATRYSSRPRLEILEDRQLPSTFAVINTSDSGDGSLRQAILDANAHPGLDTIIFDIRPGGVQTIMPTSALPTITDPVVIDGTFQPGYAGTPLIVINGSQAGNVDGLTITAGNSTVRGLVLNGYDGFHEGVRDAAIRLETRGGNVILGNFIGTDVTGTRAVANSIGVIIADAPQNIIGGTAIYAGNLISGNDVYGISISSSDNLVLGNLIGTDVRGAASIRNSVGGVFINSGTHGNSIGGTDTGAANVISGNGGYGIFILASNNNSVQGNIIGTDATGLRNLGNDYGGIIIQGGMANMVGGTIVGAGNLISGSGLSGVSILGSTNNLVQGNVIGTDIGGAHAVANDIGITVQGGTDNLIGGTVAGAGNLISGSRRDGVYILGGTANVVRGNLIGTDSSGTQSLANGGTGVLVLGGNENIIGGAIAHGSNTIAFNREAGVRVNTGIDNAILRNAIFSNGVLGIELENGGNHNQEAPVIASATSVGGVTTITGALHSAPNTTYTIELFANTTCDPSGFGEGERFVAALTVATNATGKASFTLAVALWIDPGAFITASATDPQNNTSQFSACEQVTGDGSSPVLVTLSGTLNLIMVNGFRPPAPSSYTILTFAGRTQTFGTITPLDLGGGLILTPVYNATDFTLTASQTSLGGYPGRGNQRPVEFAGVWGKAYQVVQEPNFQSGLEDC